MIDRDSFQFTARRTLNGVEVAAEFMADKVSNPAEGLRYYQVDLIIDPTNGSLRSGEWRISTANSSELAIYNGPKDRLKKLEHEARDEFTRRYTSIWEMIRVRQPDPNFIVDAAGELLPPLEPIRRL